VTDRDFAPTDADRDRASITQRSQHGLSYPATVGAQRPLAPSRAGANGRNGGMDALRAAVTLLVVFHHTAITYGAIGGWYYKEIAPSNSPGALLLILFCTVNQAWFMGLFFLLAGYYTPPLMTGAAPPGLSANGCCGLAFRLPSTFFSCIPSRSRWRKRRTDAPSFMCSTISSVMDGSNPARCGSRRRC
jgi:hypothetical protein